VVNIAIGKKYQNVRECSEGEVVEILQETLIYSPHIGSTQNGYMVYVHGQAKLPVSGLKKDMMAVVPVWYITEYFEEL
jgi:hypothetical protein